MKVHPADNYRFLSEHQGPGGMYIQITCSRCGTTDSRRQKFKEMSIDGVHLPYWRNKGWTFKKNDAICVRCRDQEHRKKHAAPLTTTIGDAVAAKLTVVEPVTESPIAEPVEISTPQPPAEEMTSKKPEPEEPEIVSEQLRPNLRLTAERNAFDKEVFEVLERSGQWMLSLEIQAVVGGGLQQIRNSLHRLIDNRTVDSRGATSHTQYKVKKSKPVPVVPPPLPTPTRRVHEPRKMRFHAPEFKRYVVETALDLKPRERDKFYESVGLHTGNVPYFKREYIEGKLGTLDKPIKIVPLHIKLEPLRSRKFTDNYKQRVLIEIAKAKDEDEYLRVRGLTRKLLASWQNLPETTTPMDTKLQFRLYDLLREHCPQGKYKAGWSDDIVARELKISRADVLKVRSEVYEPAIDPAIVGLREDLAHLKNKFDEDMKGLRDLEKSIRDDFQRQFDGLSDRLAAVEAYDIKVRA